MNELLEDLQKHAAMDPDVLAAKNRYLKERKRLKRIAAFQEKNAFELLDDLTGYTLEKTAGTELEKSAGILSTERQLKKAERLAEQEKTAGESMPARYKKIDWDNDPTGEKKKIKRKLLASGALGAAGLGVNLHQLALATHDMVKNTNRSNPNINLVGTTGGGIGLLLAEKQLQKAEKLDGLPVGGTPNRKKSRLDSRKRY